MVRPGVFARPAVVAWSDASAKDGAYRIGGFVDVIGVGRKGFSIVVPSEYIDALAQSPIMLLEVLAAFFVVRLFGNYLRDVRTVFRVDNTSGLFSIVNGMNRSCPATSHLIYFMHIELSKLGCLCWFEYVMTLLNSSDGLSRENWLECAEELGVDLYNGFLPPWPQLDSKWVRRTDCNRD